MGIFARRSEVADLRAHEFVLTDCPVVAQDRMVVLVDANVRLESRTDLREGEEPRGYDPADEKALSTVFVLVLRLLADRTPSEELLTGRALVVEALEQGFAFAPVGTGLLARATHAEVRPHDEAAPPYRHAIRPAVE